VVDKNCGLITACSEVTRAAGQAPRDPAVSSAMPSVRPERPGVHHLEHIRGFPTRDVARLRANGRTNADFRGQDALEVKS
jgi:hypothetical protein